MLTAHGLAYADRATIKTFAESTAAIVAVCIALRRAFRINHPAVPFFLSLALSFLISFTDGTPHDRWTWVLAVVNGCMLYCAVIGANENAVAVAAAKPAGKGQQQGKGPPPPKRLLASYFH